VSPLGRDVHSRVTFGDEGIVWRDSIATGGTMPGGAKAGGVDTNDIFERIRKKAEKNVRSDGPVMKCLKFAIHPENYLRLKWDLLVFALVLYSSVAYVAAPYISIFMACCACPRYE
jgi:hypothetical protein